MGVAIHPRRNHTAIIIDNNLLIYGGIDGQGNYLHDVWLLKLNTKIWKWKLQKIIDETSF